MENLTVEMAKNLRHGQILAHTDHKNADGTCVRWRVNGDVKTYKKRPDIFQVPLKHGLRDYGYCTNTNYFVFHLNGTCPNCGR
jgi:hypothetical protein